MGKSQLYLSAADAGLELSREEFFEADFDDTARYERVDGRLVSMSPAGHDHQETAEPVRDYLVVYKLAHRDLVEHVFEEAWTTVDEGTDRISDIAVYLRSSQGRIPQRTPDVIFEIVSDRPEDRRRDYEEKRSEFERLGVKEYVIVDRYERKVTVLRLKNGRYEEHVLGPDDCYTSPLLPGLEIPLAEVL